MFSEQKRSSASKNKRKGANAGGLAVTILTSGCHFEGKLYCKGASRIGGRIQGKVISEGLLIIEEEACIEADIVVDEVIVLGKINGKLRANKRIELCESSHFQGEIITPTLVIKEGACFDGQAIMSEAANTELDAALQRDLPKQTHEPQLSAAEPRPSGNDKMPDVSIINSA